MTSRKLNSHLVVYSEWCNCRSQYLEVKYFSIKIDSQGEHHRNQMQTWKNELQEQLVPLTPGPNLDLSCLELQHGLSPSPYIYICDNIFQAGGRN